MGRPLSLGKDKSPLEGELLKVSGGVGYTVESKPGTGRGLRWRLPTLVLTLASCAVVYFSTRPYCQVAGRYEGRIGGEVSSNKIQLLLKLRQSGTNLAGTCELSQQYGGRMLVRQAELTGKAGADSFRLSGPLEKTTVFFQGEPHIAPSNAPQVIGTFWQEADGIATDPAPFQGTLIHARVSPEDLSVRQKNERD